MSGTGTLNPVAYPALFAQPKGFSEYVGDVTKYSQTSDPSISANPSVNRVSRAIDGVNKTHLTISDLAKTKIFPETIRVYSEKYGGALNFLTNRFNTIVTDQNIWEIESYKANRDLWALAVMNTTAPVISFEFHSQSGSSTFTQQGVRYDSYALMKREAVQKLDYEIGAVNANIIAHHAVVATVAILQAYSSYARSAIFCSYMSDNITPLVAFQNMASLHGIFNKSEFACSTVFSQCDRVFGNRGFRELITSRESALGMLMNSDINLNFAKSGEGAVSNQQRVDIPVTIMGKRITALPVVDPAPQRHRMAISAV